METIKITAHSGCEGTAMNSMEYLQLALQLPIDFIEIDVRRAEDGRLILTHDRAEDQLLITLEDAFRMILPGQPGVNCDLKEYGLEEDVLRCAEKCGLTAGRFLFTGSVTDCRHFKERHPDVTVHINPEELVPDFYDRMKALRNNNPADAGGISGGAREEALEELLKACHESGYDTINVNYRVCDREMLRRCREEKIALSVWTVDDPEDMRSMINLGVSGITTNYPSRLTEVLR